MNDRVANKVAEDLFDPNAIGQDHLVRAFAKPKSDRDAARLSLHFKRIADRFRKVGWDERDRVDGQVLFWVHGLTHVGQNAEKLVCCLAQAFGEVLLVRFVIVKVVDKHRNHRRRCPQFVADDREHLFLLILTDRQFGQGFLERAFLQVFACHIYPEAINDG